MSCRGRITHRPPFGECVLLAGFPGVGFAAPLAVYHVERSLGCVEVAEIFCPSLGGAVTDGEGGLISRTLKLRAVRLEEDALLTTWTVSQPESAREAYDLCEELIRLSKELGCRLMVSMTSISGVRRGGVYYAASSRETLRGVDGRGMEVYEGEIRGLSGLLTALCGLGGVDCVCLLASSADVAADLEASSALLRYAGRIAGIEFSLKGLEDSAGEFMRLLKMYGG